MARPSKKDLAGLQARIEKHNKQIGAEGYIPEGKIMVMLRSAIRQVWMYSPVKLAVLEEGTEADLDDNNRKWKVRCAICDKYHKKGDIEVDHIHGNHSLKKPEDFPEFFNKILNVRKEDLQLVCKPCHEIKTHMEKPENEGMTWEEAIVAKKVIAWFNKNKKAADQKRILLKQGFSESEVANDTKREACVKSVYEKMQKQGKI